MTTYDHILETLVPLIDKGGKIYVSSELEFSYLARYLVDRGVAGSESLNQAQREQIQEKPYGPILSSSLRNGLPIHLLRNLSVKSEQEAYSLLREEDIHIALGNGSSELIQIASASLAKGSTLILIGTSVTSVLASLSPLQLIGDSKEILEYIQSLVSDLERRVHRG
jgi:hypothetical protein